MAERVPERANPGDAAEVSAGRPQIREPARAPPGATVVVVAPGGSVIGVAPGAPGSGPHGASLLREPWRRGGPVGCAITVASPEGPKPSPSDIVAGLGIIATAGRGRALGTPVGRRRANRREWLRGHTGCVVFRGTMCHTPFPGAPLK